MWPPTGIALAAVLLFGARVWPALFLGAFLVNVTTVGTLFTSLGIATGNTLEALFGAWMIARFARGTRAFDHAADVLRFALCGGLVAPGRDGDARPARLARGDRLQRLRIMRYRAGIVGGMLEVRSRPSGGSMVLCSAPMPAG